MLPIPDYTFHLEKLAKKFFKKYKKKNRNLINESQFYVSDTNDVLIRIILFTKEQSPFQIGLMERISYWFQ